MRKKIFCVALLLFGLTVFGQKPKRILKKLVKEPVFFVDSINVYKSEIGKYDPTEIASVTVFKDKEAIDLVGENGEDGVIYIETINFAKKRYWKYFVSKSKMYAEVVPNVKGDSIIQYILNKRILDKNFEGTLSSIDDNVFEGIEVITKKELQTNFQINDKEYGVIIKSGKPKNLYKARKKF